MIFTDFFITKLEIKFSLNISYFQRGLFVLSNTSPLDSSFYNSTLSPKIEINSNVGCWHCSSGAKLYFLGKTLISIRLPNHISIFSPPVFSFAVKAQHYWLVPMWDLEWNSPSWGLWGESKGASGIHHSCQAMCFPNSHFLPQFFNKDHFLKELPYLAASFPASLARFLL